MKQGGRALWRQYPYWARGPAKIEGDEIVLDENRSETYYMFEPEGIVFDLADLATQWERPEPPGILAFVRRYGLLWHGKDDLGTGECRESLNDWSREAITLAVILDAIIKLKQAAETGSARPLRDLSGPLEGMYADETASDQDIMNQVSLDVGELITRKMEDTRQGLVSSVGVTVEPKDPRLFLLSNFSPNLVAAAHSQLALYVVHRAPITTCPGCGRAFNPKSGKQKYCSSSCANTSRWRRWKERQAE